MSPPPKSRVNVSLWSMSSTGVYLPALPTRAGLTLRIALEWWPQVAILLVVISAVAVVSTRSTVSEIRCPEGGTPLVMADARTRPAVEPTTAPGTSRAPWLAATSPPKWRMQWRSPLTGHSGLSCVIGQRIAVVTAQPESTNWLLRTVDISTGQTLWERALVNDRPPQADAQGTARAPLPCSDGERLFVPHTVADTLRLSSFARDGQPLWSCEVGPDARPSAYIAAPVVFGPLVILNVDQSRSKLVPWERRSYLVAVHRQTGEIIWRTRRSDAQGDGSPVIATIAGRPQLLVPGRSTLCSYQPDDGREIWRCRWKAHPAACQIVANQVQVFASNGTSDGEVLAVRADGHGDVTATHVQWRDRRTLTGPVALALADSLLIQQQPDGVIVALDQVSGRTVWRKTVNGHFSVPPLVRDRRLVCATDEGLMSVLDLERRGELLLQTPLHETITTVPVLMGDSLLIGTARGLARWQDTSGTRVVNEPAAERQVQ